MGLPSIEYRGPVIFTTCAVGAVNNAAAAAKSDARVIPSFMIAGILLPDVTKHNEAARQRWSRMEPLRPDEIVSDVFTEQLVGAEMQEGEAKRKAELFGRACATLDARGSDTARAAELCFVPGRIEVFGKHTDYAGGRSLLAAIERGFCVAWRARADSGVHLVDACSGERAAFEISEDPGPPGKPWTIYARTVIRRVARNFPTVRCGADIAFASDLPPAAGLSSSSALMIAIFLAISEVNSLSATREYRENIASPLDLASYLSAVEAGEDFGKLGGGKGVGTFGGSEDHTAILCCRAGELSQFSFCPTRLEQNIPFPEDVIFVVANSGVLAEKTGAALELYNGISRAARKILELWRRGTGRADISLAAAATSSPEAPDQIRSMLASSTQEAFSAQTLLNRFEQFMHETFVNVPQAAEAFARSNWGALGRISESSQDAAAKLLGNQTTETLALAELARENGALAASAFGAGFGGSVWALVPVSAADEFWREWQARYASRFAAAARASFFLARPGPASMRLTLG